MKLRDRINRWVYAYCDKRDHLPWLVRKFYRKAHWCPEMDDLLCLTKADQSNCFCGYGRPTSEWETASEQWMDDDADNLFTESIAKKLRKDTDDEIGGSDAQG